MANPKSRHSRSRRNKRRANWKGITPSLDNCPACDEPKIPHRVCLSCGTYNGKKVLQVVEKDA
jgi:large subunit ribosomal protein L32